MFKNVRSIIFLCHTIFSLASVMAQDKPDGFASVSALGLETTTGGEGGTVIIADKYSLLARYAGSNRPYIIIVKGQFESTTFKQVNVGSNTTIIGHETNATLKNIGFVMNNRENIIIRNLRIMDSFVEGDWEGKTNDNDGIRADSCHHVWIDHCFVSHCGDGLIDLRKSCNYVTVSYTHLSNHNKAFGLGWTDNPDWWVTMHHLWWDNTNQRNPSFGRGKGHLYNNYLSDVSSYGNNSRDATLIVQNSVFERVNKPIEATGIGILYASGNSFTDCSGSKTGNVSEMPFDPTDFYDYRLDPTNEVKEIVKTQSGPQQAVSDQYFMYNAIEKVENTDNRIQYHIDQKNSILKLNSDRSEKVKVLVYSIDGKIIKVANIILPADAGLSLADQSKGVYLVQFAMNNKIESGKIVLK